MDTYCKHCCDLLELDEGADPHTWEVNGFCTEDCNTFYNLARLTEVLMDTERAVCERVESDALRTTLFLDIQLMRQRIDDYTLKGQ